MAVTFEELIATARKEPKSLEGLLAREKSVVLKSSDLPRLIPRVSSINLSKGRAAALRDQLQSFGKSGKLSFSREFLADLDVRYGEDDSPAPVPMMEPVTTFLVVSAAIAALGVGFTIGLAVGNAVFGSEDESREESYEVNTTSGDVTITTGTGGK